MGIQQKPWNIVLGSCLCYILLVGLTRCFGVFYTVIIEEYDTTRTAAAVVISIQNGIRCMFAPFVYMLTLYLGLQWSVILGGLLFSAGIMMTVLYPSILMLYATFGVISGMGASIVVVVPYMAVNEGFMGTSWHSKAMSISTMGIGIGTIIFAPISESLLVTYGYKGAMLMMGAIQLNLCVGGALLGGVDKEDDVITETTRLTSGEKTNSPKYVVEPERVEVISAFDSEFEESDQQPLINGNHNGSANGTSGNNSNNRHPMLEKIKAWFWHIKGLCTLSLILFMFCMMIMSTVVFSSLLFIDQLGMELGIPASGTSWILSIMGFTDMIGRLVFGILFDFKVFHNRKHFFEALLGIMLGMTTVGISVARDYKELVICSAIFGVTGGGYLSQSMTSLSELVPRNKISQAISVAIAIQGIGQFAGPTFQGLLNDYFNTSRASYFTSGAVFAVASLLCAINFCVRRCTMEKWRQFTNRE